MEKIKQFLESEKGKDILIVIIVILVGLCSFGLGRLSKNVDSSGIKILSRQEGEYKAQDLKQEANTISSVAYSSKTFFASKQGSKYYSLGCSAGKSIKQENRIYFDTKENAERAGYELSSSCR